MSSDENKQLYCQFVETLNRRGIEAAGAFFADVCGSGIGDAPVAAATGSAEGG